MAEKTRKTAAKPKTVKSASARKRGGSAAKPRTAKASAQAKSSTRPARQSDGGGFDVAKLLEHPLVADLLAVGAMAAVAAIADHNVKSRTGELGPESRGAVKAAGKAAAAAIGRRLMTEVNEVRKAARPAED